MWGAGQNPEKAEKLVAKSDIIEKVIADLEKKLGGIE
jgi:hypothetical protein